MWDKGARRRLVCGKGPGFFGIHQASSFGTVRIATGMPPIPATGHSEDQGPTLRSPQERPWEIRNGDLVGT